MQRRREGDVFVIDSETAFSKVWMEKLDAPATTEAAPEKPKRKKQASTKPEPQKEPAQEPADPETGSESEPI